MVDLASWLPVLAYAVPSRWQVGSWFGFMRVLKFTKVLRGLRLRRVHAVWSSRSAEAMNELDTYVERRRCGATATTATTYYYYYY